MLVQCTVVSYHGNRDKKCINWKQNQLIPCWYFIKYLDLFVFPLNYYYLHVQMQKSVFKNKVKGQTLTLSSVGTALVWCSRPCSGKNSRVERRIFFIFFWLFFWCSNSYRLKDPLTSCLNTLKQTPLFSDSSRTCILLPFSTFLLAFCHQRVLQEKRIIIINFKEVICSCFISLSP